MAEIYPEGAPLENEAEEEEEAETVIAAQETISAAIRLATSLSSRGKLSDVFLQHLRNAVLKLTEYEAEEQDYGYEEPAEGAEEVFDPSQGIDESCRCRRSFSAPQPTRVTPFEEREGISLSDHTRKFWERELKRLDSVSSDQPRRPVPRKLSPARPPFTSATYSFESSYGDVPGNAVGTPTSPPMNVTYTSPPQSQNNYSMGAPARPPTNVTYTCPPRSQAYNYSANESTAPWWLSIDSLEPVSFDSSLRFPGSSFGHDASGSIPWLPSPDNSQFSRSSGGVINATSSGGRRSTMGSGRGGASTTSQFLPDLNSTNVSGSWGTPSRLASPPVECSYSYEHSSDSIPSWRVSADRNAMRGPLGVHSWAGNQRARSVSPAGRRSLAREWEFVPSEDSSMASRSWRSRSSGPSLRSPVVSYPDSGISGVQPSSQCPSCDIQSGDESSLFMNTFGGAPSSPDYLPFRFRRNWSIAPVGAQPGELSREESWRYIS